QKSAQIRQICVACTKRSQSIRVLWDRSLVPSALRDDNFTKFYTLYFSTFSTSLHFYSPKPVNSSPRSPVNPLVFRFSFFVARMGGASMRCALQETERNRNRNRKRKSVL